MSKRNIIWGIIAIVICIVSSCSKSPEEKIKDLVSVEIKKNLYIPDSYDLADIKVDSAFIPLDSPELFEYINQFAEIDEEYTKTENAIQEANRDLAIWDDPFSAFAKQRKNEAKKDLKEAEDNREELSKAGSECLKKIKSIIKQKPQFFGFKAIVSYRAKNNAGNILMDNIFALTDQKAEKLVYMCSMDDYKKMEEAIIQLIEEE